MNIPNLTKMHANMATAAFPKGARLECDVCGRAENASSDDCGRYLATGWPKHCGQTMKLSGAKP